MASKPTKTTSRIGAQHVTMATESRFSPLRYLEPETLVQYIESYEAGDFLRDTVVKVALALGREPRSVRAMAYHDELPRRPTVGADLFGGDKRGGA